MSRPEATLDIEPPNDLHAERALLGALMLAHDAHLVEVDPADFHRESHRRLLEAIVEAGSSGPVDAIAVGGIVPDLRLLITECQSEVDLVCSAPGHAKTVSEMARRRRIRRAAQEMIAGIDGGRETEDVEADALALFTRSRPMDAAVSLQEMVRGEIEALSRPQECVYIEGFPGIAIYGGDSAVV
jgi:replicative DNA helicase